MDAQDLNKSTHVNVRVRSILNFLWALYRDLILLVLFVYGNLGFATPFFSCKQVEYKLLDWPETPLEIIQRAARTWDSSKLISLIPVTVERGN